MEIKIDKGVPVPPQQVPGRKSKWPWKDMEPGDSFFAAGYATKAEDGAMVMNGTNGRRVAPGTKWCARTRVENGVKGVRVWRKA